MQVYDEVFTFGPVMRKLFTVLKKRHEDIKGQKEVKRSGS